MKPAGFDPTTGRVLLGLGLIAAYVGLCLSPLVIVSIGHREAGRSFLVELSVGLGYVGLVMMTLQLALVSRIRWVAAPFGVDLLQRFHREVSYVALAFILAHPALLLAQSPPTYLPLFNVVTSPWRARLALGSLVALVLLVLLSIWRLRLKVPYELWKVTHNGLAWAVIGLGLGHMIGVNRFSATLGGRVVIVAVVVAVIGITGWTKVIEPRLYLLKAWRVVDLVSERGGAITLVMRPDGHRGWAFMPGQFAWLALGRSPLRGTAQHPFSFSSPGDVQPGGTVAMTIKGAGDWSQSMALVEPGARVFLDGPHGSFSIDRQQGPGYVLVGGGVGITPLFSMIVTMHQRGDSRPVVLFYTSPDWESVTFREQLDDLCAQMRNLTVVHILRDPPPDWTGETGRITADLLRRHLPARYQTFECFVCAGGAMMDSVEQALVELGVPDYRIHSERFAMV
jgi:predicted ferric reductase